MSIKNTQQTMRPQSPFFIFDIETVPDIPLLCQKYGAFDEAEMSGSGEHWNDLSLYKKIAEQNKIEFPQTLFHAVVSICGVFVDPESYTIMDGIKLTIPAVNSYDEFRREEKNIIQKFWEFSIKYENFHQQWYDHNINDRFLSDYQKNKLKKLPVTFCGYNISGFDLLVLEQRSLINFITCPIDDYAKNLGMDSYRYKYASDKVFDLINFVANYDNRNAKIGLDILATALGLGGKMTGMDGSHVAHQYFNEKNSKIIEEYCAIDVLITYGVFLAVQKFRGILDAGQLSECLKWFETWLCKEGRPESYWQLAKKSQAFFSKDFDKENSYC